MSPDNTANLHYVGKVATRRYALSIKNVLNHPLDSPIMCHESDVGEVAEQ